MHFTHRTQQIDILLAKNNMKIAYLFPTLKKGEGGLPFMRGEGRIHIKGKRLVIVVCLNDFCP